MARIRPRTEVKSGPSTVSGTSTAPIIGSGSPQSSDAATIGAATREITGSGVLQATDSTVSGSDDAGTLLTWSKPSQRQDGTAISAGEIAGYTIYLEQGFGNFVEFGTVSGEDTLSFTVTGLGIGVYGFRVAADLLGGDQTALSDTIILEIT